VTNFKKMKNSPAFRRVAAMYPRYAAKAESVRDWFGALTNIDFIDFKARHPGFGVPALIRDYDLMGELAESNISELTSTEINQRIQKALRLRLECLLLWEAKR